MICHIVRKGIIEELLFFLRGETDTKKLEAVGVNIWKGNTSREFLDNKGLNYLPEGSLGKGYGYQWRNFGGTEINKGIDQISNAIDLIKNNPDSRRILVSAWNPLQQSEMALEPCHCLFQFYVFYDFYVLFLKNKIKLVCKFDLDLDFLLFK
jgi:thymidylate synthase